MSGFIVKAACRGRRPSQFASFNGIERQDLVNRLLEEREVARFIVAPSGYGKTAIAVEYAETMFSWVHTFFINCQSPCFIRDLDDGSIAEACKSADSQIRLVVFDALPPLDAQRSKLFSHEVNALLSSKCEVIVTCAPASDVLGQYQVDQIRLGPSDLLLSDNELDAARSLSERRKMPSEKLSAAHRVPALVWGEGDKVVSLFLKLSFQEPIPADLLLAMASMYVLGRGTLEDLASFGPIDDDLVEHIRNAYPHLCIDADQGYFDVPFASIDDISDALRTQIDSIVSRSTFAARDELVLAWADALMDKRGDADRACDVVRILCPRSHRGNWIASHADELVRRGCFYSILKAIFVMSTKARDTSAQVKAATSTLEAICRMILGDYPGAVTCANRFAFDGGARFDLRVRCLLVIDRLAVGNAKKQATDRLEALAEALDAKPVSALSLEEGLVRAWRASNVGVDALGGEWANLHASGADDETLCIVASTLFTLLGEQLDDSSHAPFVRESGGVVEAERYVRERIGSKGAKDADYLTVSAALSLESARAKGLSCSSERISAVVMNDLRQREAALSQQREDFRREGATGNSGKGGVAHNANVAPLFAEKIKRSVPVLEVTLFGGFDVTIGGAPVDQKLFSRQSLRSLLALLAINLNREIPRLVLARKLWPSSPEHLALKNYYSVSSQLRHALTLSDGTCPYVMRSQNGYRLDKRHVQTDVSRFEEIIRELQFKERRHRDWASIYEDLDANFGSELMPSEMKNEAVIQARKDYRNRLVDALVVATQTVIESGSPNCGVLFARMAVKHDDVREDAYLALMKAQVANGQTSSAIVTYHTCLETLDKKLGVYPSSELSEYFETLLK